MEINRILITGGNGFLGSVTRLECIRQYPKAIIFSPSSSELDLKDREKTVAYFLRAKPDVVISIAARLGGIGDNQNYPATYFYDNIIIGINTVDASRISSVSKIINIGTVCSYPKIVPVPFLEEDLWNGYPEPTNGAYGIAKKAVGEYAQSVKKQYGMSCVNLLLTNLYGPGDDFREETSHVIPALIKKIVTAKENNDKQIIAWGDGSPTRDFLYVEDAAKGIVNAIKCDESLPVNLGSGSEISIKDLFQTLKTLIGYTGEVYWDTTKPNGQPKRILNIDKARRLFDFNPEVNFEEGIKNTIEWYLSNRTGIDALNSKFSD